MADPYRFDPLQFAVDQAEQNSRGVPPKPGGYGLGAVANALWRSLPQNVRQRYATVPNALAELSPGAGARDMVQSSGDLSQNVLAGNPLGSINAMAGIGLGAMGMIPGARAPAAVAKELTAKAADAGVDRVAKALAFGAPTEPRAVAAAHPRVDQYGFLSPQSMPAGAPHQAVTNEARNGGDAIARALTQTTAPELARLMGMSPQGGNKWSQYFGDRQTGANLRVSDHGAFNPGSMGTGVNAHGVTFDVGSGELVLSSPAIKRSTGHDKMYVPIPEESWGALSSPEGQAWIVTMLRGEF